MDIFINSIRNHPCLWDTSCKSYSSSEKKAAAWLQVMDVNEFDDVLAAKRQWKKLRDNHREAIKRQIGRNTRPWKYQKLMEFLIPVMHVRTKSINADEIDEMEAASSDSVDESIEVNGDEPYEPPKKLSKSANDEEPEEDEEEEQLVLQFLHEQKVERSKRNQEIEPIKGEIKRSDALTTFFASMCGTTQKLPYSYQIQIKKKLFYAVMEAEEQHEEQQQNYQYIQNYTPPASQGVKYKK